MPGHKVRQFLRRFRLESGLVGEAVPDQHLLDCFITQRDEYAFAALLARHGPMVLGVCRRVLHDEHWAEDVCQATFLTLARNAGRIRKRNAVGSWLHGVALRLAHKARGQTTPPAKIASPPAAMPSPDPLVEVSWREVRQILDEELGRLPERYRLPLIMCYLEGQSRDEAAAQLGWSPGKVKGLLERGREHLRTRLIRRGLTLSAAGTSLLADAALAVPIPPLLSATTRLAALRLVEGASRGVCGISATVYSLLEGGLPKIASKTMALVLALVLVTGAAGLGAGLLVRGTDGSATPSVAPPTWPVQPVKAAAFEGDKRSKKEKPAEPKPEKRPPPADKDSAVQGFAFDAKGQFIVTVGRDAKIHVRQRATGKQLWELAGPPGDWVGVIVFSPDGGLLAALCGNNSSNDTTVILWDMTTGTERQRFRGSHKGAAGLAFAPDGKSVATHGGDAVRLWDVATGKLLRSFALPAEPASDCTFAPDGSVLAIAYRTGQPEKGAGSPARERWGDGRSPLGCPDRQAAGDHPTSR